MELSAKIKSKEVSSLELTELYISRIEELDDKVNSVVVRTFDQAIEDAKKADLSISKGENLGPLHGLPMTIKESYVLKDQKTTWGMPEFKDNVASEDGLAVKRFRNAGAHFIGKTNVPLQLADFQSYNEIYGTTGNPWNVTKTPGGSSGGSAAALAAGFTGLEAGSDIGGSIRNPAHYCGVYGHKPTYGIVPMSGHELVSDMPEHDLSVCGPMARSAEDLSVALNIMAGPYGREAKGWKLDLNEPNFKELKDLRVAVWATDELAPVSQEISDRAIMVGETLSKLGSTVSFDARPNFDKELAAINYQTLLNSVMSMALPPEEVQKIQNIVNELDENDMSFEAVTARSSVLPHREWLRANIYRESLKIAWNQFFESWDILICPQQATTAFDHDHRKFSERTLRVNNEEQPYFQQIFWAGMIVNSHLPSTVFPTGPSNDGLPIGLQAVSGCYKDRSTIKFASLIANEIGGFIPPPDFA
jgi:amidase